MTGGLSESRPALSSIIATGHMWLFKFKRNLKLNSSITPATFHVFNPHVSSGYLRGLHTFPLSQKAILDRTGLDPTSYRKWEMELEPGKEKALRRPYRLRLVSIML